MIHYDYKWQESGMLAPGLISKRFLPVLYAGTNNESKYIPEIQTRAAAFDDHTSTHISRFRREAQIHRITASSNVCSTFGNHIEAAA